MQSFDIFDTLISRSTGSPENTILVFAQTLLNKGSISVPAEIFARARLSAEARAFRNQGGLDSHVSLLDIYRELAFALRMDESSLSALAASEVEFEKSVWRLIPEGVRRLEQARRSGEKIAFISDMYLENDLIKNFLQESGLLQSGDDLWVSSALALSKSEGSIYRYVIRHHGVSASQIVHHGNHFWSDDRSPKRIGIRTRPFFQGNFNRFEECLNEGSWSTNGWSGCLAGAARLARLSLHGGEGPDVESLRTVAAGVAAPQVIDFVLWCLFTAASRQVRTVFFLARDGQLLLEIARELNRHLELPLNLKYLYASRQSWVLPSLRDVSEENLQQAIPDAFDLYDLSVRDMLDRLELKPEQISQELRDYGFTSDQWSRRLSHPERLSMRGFLSQNPTVRAIIQQKCSESRALLIEYFAQEGVLDGSTAIVDNGTGVTLHNAIGSILSSIGKRPPLSLYHGRRPGVKDVGFGLPEVYLNNSVSNLGYFDLPGLNTLMEMICVADHPSVIRFERKMDRIEPVFGDGAVVQAQKNWGRDVVRETILLVARNLEVKHYKLEASGDCRSVFESLQKMFWLSPSEPEARKWGRFPFEDGWSGRVVATTIAKPYSLRSLIRPLLKGHAHDGRHWWHEAALRMTPPVIRRLYLLALYVSVRAGRLFMRLRQG